MGSHGLKELRLPLLGYSNARNALIDNVGDEDKTEIIEFGEQRSICLNPGDGLVYKGCERPHWRTPLKSRYNIFQRSLMKLLKKEDDTYYHQVFFHYVLSDGSRCTFAGD